jgi:hypothetical protein
VQVFIPLIWWSIVVIACHFPMVFSLSFAGHKVSWGTAIVSVYVCVHLLVCVDVGICLRAAGVFGPYVLVTQT